jgi:dTDP-4-dehydrorhamnose reductase
MRPILLIGASGQVGQQLQRSLVGVAPIVCSSRNEVDLENNGSIRDYVIEINPSLIINAAAYTKVEAAEQDSDRAMQINGIAPGVMAEVAQKIDAGLIHYSTDYVFDGIVSRPYQEADRPNPLNVYGQTKLAGEEAVQVVGGNYWILRTSWVYGLQGQNFLLTMLRLAQQRETLQVVRDQIGSPTWSGTIAAVTAEMLRQRGLQIERSGIYHLSCAGETSWYEFALAIFSQTADWGDRRLKRVLPILAMDYPSKVYRPAYSVLDITKLQRSFQIVLPHWRSALADCLADGHAVWAQNSLK